MYDILNRKGIIGDMEVIEILKYKDERIAEQYAEINKIKEAMKVVGMLMKGH